MKLNLKNNNSATNYENSREDIIVNKSLNSNDDPKYISRDNEIWKVVEGFEDYLVSDKGQIFSLLQHKILKQDLQKNGYYDVRIKNRDGNFIHRKAHSLTACAFCPNFENKPIIHHKDGNSKNNNAENLMWVTNSEHWELHRKMREEKKKKALEDKSEEGATTNEPTKDN